MIFLAILFALSILVIEYTIARKLLENRDSMPIYAGGFIAVLFISVVDGLLFTMGLTKKVDVTATYLGLCLPSGLLMLAFAAMLLSDVRKMAQDSPKKIIEIGDDRKPHMLASGIWGAVTASVFYGFFAAGAGIYMLLAVTLKFNAGFASMFGAALAFLAVWGFNSQYPKRLRAELIGSGVLTAKTQTYEGGDRKAGTVSARDKGNILCYGGVLVAFLVYCFTRSTTIATVLLFLGVLASLPYYRRDVKERRNR